MKRTQVQASGVKQLGGTSRSKTAADANNNNNTNTGSGSVQTSASTNSNSIRPSSSSFKSPIIPKSQRLDISPELLRCLKTWTKRDFEHAAVETEDLDTVDEDYNNKKGNNFDYVPPPRPPSRKSGNNATEGFKFFAQAPTPPPPLPGYTHTRPMTTVPKLQFEDIYGSNGYAGHQAEERNILRSMSAGASTNVTKKVTTSTSTQASCEEGKVKPLTKSKVTPALELEYSFHSAEEASRPFTAGDCSDSSFISGYSDYDDCESERPNTTSGAKRVTFAADVVNYERESKPSKRRKMPKRRKQGFPHPSRGIFIPPESEIVESSGPIGICKENPYLNFNQVWTHPSARCSGESAASQQIRQERFHRLMSDLEHAHIHYNRLTNIRQNDYLTQCIFKRYILVLDLALTECHLNQVEHLLETISKSVPVLHQNTFFFMYGAKSIQQQQENKNSGDKCSSFSDEAHPDLLLARYSLSRISGPLPRHDASQMSLETVLVKLCLELIEVVFAPFASLTYRNALNTLPYTVRQAIILLRELKEKTDSFAYIKWINNSAVQRDFRSILKNVGLLDRFGCKAEIPEGDCCTSGGFGSKQKKISVFPGNVGSVAGGAGGTRPGSASPIAGAGTGSSGKKAVHSNPHHHHHPPKYVTGMR